MVGVTSKPQSIQMNEALLAKLLKLTPAERIQLAQDLWDSIAPEDMPPLTDEQIAEIDRRLAEHARDPARALPWEEVRANRWASIRMT
jgi:putative addiction module component (TIGR02574 family)